MFEITLPGLGPAYTPPSLGQDNPGSSTGYMPLIIKTAGGGGGVGDFRGHGRRGNLTYAFQYSVGQWSKLK